MRYPRPVSSGVLHIAEVPYPSGAIKCRYAFVVSPDGSRRIRHGRYVRYHPDGSIASEGTYEDGLESGEWRDYYANGQLAAAGLYVNGKEEGVWRFWDEAGTPEGEALYRAGALR